MVNNKDEPQKQSRKYHFELKSKEKIICKFQALIYKLLPNSVSSDIFAMALHEIIVNAAEHGNQMQAAKKVIIDLIIKQEYICAEVKDQGEGFDWEQKLKEEFDISGGSERGRGIMMTARACDQFYYNQRGNTAYLVKKNNF